MTRFRNSKTVLFGKLITGNARKLNSVKNCGFVRAKSLRCQVTESFSEKDNLKISENLSKEFLRECQGKKEDKLFCDRAILEPLQGYNGPNYKGEKNHPERKGQHSPSSFELTEFENNPAICYEDTGSINRGFFLERSVAFDL